VIYALPYVIMILWCIGGQWELGARRYGVPTIATFAVVLFRTGKPSERWRALVLLLLIPILCVGYGINSALMHLVERIVPRESFRTKDLIIRILYAIMLSLPIGIYAQITHSMYKYPIIVIALIGAFLVKSEWFGSLQSRLKIGSFDIVIEDVVRSLTLGYAIVWLVA
jgi:hypothetical protein